MDDIETRLSSLEQNVGQEIQQQNEDIKTVKQLADELVLKTDTVQSTLVSVNTQMNQEFSSLQSQIGSTISSELITLNNKLNSMTTSIDSDFNAINTELSDINGDISNKMDDHDSQTAANLANIQALLQPDETCGTLAGGWRRAVYMDMTDPNTDCPSGWQLTDYSKRTCGIDIPRVQYNVQCVSVYFPVSGGVYSHVCGRIRGYQFAWTNGINSADNTIDMAYVNGMAIMHGNPRKHIWTFAAGSPENNAAVNGGTCPCDINRYERPLPSFMGNDYFCEAGMHYPEDSAQNVFHPDDPLWDGEGCGPSSTCCTFHGPPYFTKSLSGPTSDDLEVRMCGSSNGYAPVELIELYVK